MVASPKMFGNGLSPAAMEEGAAARAHRGGFFGQMFGFESCGVLHSSLGCGYDYSTITRIC